MTYQVGELIHFREDDPVFDNEDAAYAHAYKLSDESDELVIGIWTGQEEGSEPLAIVYCGEVYCK